MRQGVGEVAAAVVVVVVAAAVGRQPRMQLGPPQQVPGW